MIRPPESVSEAMMKIARTSVLIVLVAACAAKPPSPQKGGSIPGDGRQQPDAAPDYAHGLGTTEIENLDARIRQDLAQLGIDPPTDNEVTSVMVAHTEPPLPMTSDIASTCTAPPSGGACEDVCTLADSICSAAIRICELSDAIGDDPWAIQRCTAGKLSCERATERCCGC
jgi:hypothetical protein